MKKILAFLSVIALSFVLFACTAETYEIAMITDIGDIDDKSFNQGTWEGLAAYATENGISHKYYKPSSQGLNDYVAAIELAVAGGAKIVVTPGFLFENAIHKAQTEFPEIKFVLIDGAPHNVVDWDTMATYDGSAPDFTIADNTYSIFFKEHESGFLAGYSTYKDGKTSLGFVGGLAVPAVVRFGIGFVAGAYYAAAENSTAYEFNPTYYQYAGGFAPSDDIKNLAASWYNAGVQAIHAAAGGAGNSVMAAAQEATNKFVVGVDVDQASQSSTVITSAMKGLGVAVQEALADFYADTFPGGQSVTLGAADNAVGLPTATDSWRFATFTVGAYNVVFAKISSGEIVVPQTYDELESFVDGLASGTIHSGLENAING